MNVLVIAPHPDRRSHRLRRNDRPACSPRRPRLGSVSDLGELGLKHLPREQAWRQRETEAQEAAKILGTADLIFLRRGDWFVSAA